MRLLEKQQIDAHKALEKKKEVDEGMKLARTVDNLRKVKNEEEANLRKFRDQTLIAIKAELDGLIKERDAIQTQVTALREERILAEAPIDLVKEWKQVKEDQKDIQTVKTDLFDRETKVIQQETYVESVKKDLFGREERVKEAENLAQRYVDEKKIAYDEAERVRAHVEESSTKFTKLVREEEERLRAKEHDLKMREVDLDNEKQQIEKEKADIKTEKLHIASQQATLRQAWNSIRSLKK